MFGKIVIDDEFEKAEHKTEKIAKRIREGNLVGVDWKLDLDRDRVGDDIDLVLNNIAEFIEDGLTQGMNPYWKLTIESG